MLLSANKTTEEESARDKAHQEEGTPPPLSTLLIIMNGRITKDKYFQLLRDSRIASRLFVLCITYVHVWSLHIARVWINRVRLPILLVVS